VLAKSYPSLVATRRPLRVFWVANVAKTSVLVIAPQPWIVARCGQSHVLDSPESGILFDPIEDAVSKTGAANASGHGKASDIQGGCHISAPQLGIVFVDDEGGHGFLAGKDEKYFIHRDVFYH